MSNDTTSSPDHRAIWDKNADYWDASQGSDGNYFYNHLVLPAVLHLLDLPEYARLKPTYPSIHILELASGTGVFTNHLLNLYRGVDVVSTDISTKMVEKASFRTAKEGFGEERAVHMTLDVTSRTEIWQKLRAKRVFNRVVCNMALMTIPEIDSLAMELVHLLVDEGSFIVTVLHPCFNVPSGTTRIVEVCDQDGRATTSYAIKTHLYLEVPPTKGEAISGQPLLQYYYHRPLHLLLKPFFKAGQFSAPDYLVTQTCSNKKIGFVLDGLEEPTFRSYKPEDGPISTEPSWANFQQIPPLLAFRLKKTSKKLTGREHIHPVPQIAPLNNLDPKKSAPLRINESDETDEKLSESSFITNPYPETTPTLLDYGLPLMKGASKETRTSKEIGTRNRNRGSRDTGAGKEDLEHA